MVKRKILQVSRLNNQVAYKNKRIFILSSVQFSHSVMSDSLQPHGLQHARLPCPSPTPRVCSNSCPSSQWRHLTISSSDIPFSSYLQSFPASGSFPISQFFTTGGQSIVASASVSIFPMNIWGWFPLALTDLISVLSEELSRVSRNSAKLFSNNTVQKHQFFSAQTSLCYNSHPYMTTGKTISFTRRNFVGKVMSLLFNMTPFS